MIRRTGKIFLEFLAGLVAGSVILLVAGAWWLSSGPVRLTFLTPYIEQALSPADSTVAVEIDETELQWAGWAHAVNISVSNVRVLDLERRVIAELPQVSLGLSLRAMLRGRIAPTYFEIIRPSLFVVRNADGGFAIGFARSDSKADSPGKPEGFVLERMIAELLSEADVSRPLGYLKRVGIVDGDLIVDDRRLNRIWHAPRADIEFERNAFGISANADIDLSLDGTSSRITANAAYKTETSVVDASLHFLDLDPAPILQAMSQPVAGRLAALGAHLQGSVALRMLADGSVRSVRFDIASKLGAMNGDVAIGEDGYGISAGVDIDSVGWPVLSALFPALGEKARIDAPIGGTVSVAGTTAGNVMSLEFDLTAGSGMLDFPEFYEQPVAVNAMRLRGTASDDFREFRIDEAKIAIEKGEITAHGTSTRVGQDLSLRLDGGVSGFDMALLRRYWPAGIAKDARDWVLSNIHTGSVDDATMSLVARIPDGDPGRAVIGSLNGVIRASGAEVSYFAPLAPVQGVSANMTFTDKRFDIAFTGGHIRDLKVDEGSAVITGLDGPDQHIYIDLVFRGSVNTALSVLDSKPLRFISDLGMKAGRITGETAARLVFDFPLLKNLKVNQIAVAAGATLRGVSLDDGPFGISLRNGALQLQLTGAGMTLSGEAALNGVPLNLTWEENFSGEAAFERRFTLRGAIDAAARRKLKIDELPVAGGTITGEAVRTTFRGGRSESVLRFDLTDATLDFPQIRWRKKPGVPGNVYAFVTTDAKGHTVIEDLQLTAADLKVSARIDTSGDLKSFKTLEFRDLEFAGNKMQGRVRKADNGGLIVDLTGERIDLAPFMKDVDEVDAPAATDRTPLHISARFQQVLVAEGGRLQDVQAVLVSDGVNWRQVAIDAGVGGGTRLDIELTPQGEGATLRISTRDAGRALKAANWTSRLKGGTLNVSGLQAKPGGPITGTFDLRQFKVTNVPALARVLQVLSLTGIFSALDEEGLDFVKLDGHFRYYGGAIEIKDARAFGSSIGITVEGTVYVAEETADLSGTIVPAYTINRVLGNIPILGRILTGGENEGVFAANYVVRGPLEDPQVSVNPLSALAPGFLRNLIGGDVKPLTGEDAQSQSQ